METLKDRQTWSHLSFLSFCTFPPPHRNNLHSEVHRHRKRTNVTKCRRCSCSSERKCTSVKNRVHPQAWPLIQNNWWKKRFYLTVQLSQLILIQKCLNANAILPLMLGMYQMPLHRITISLPWLLYVSTWRVFLNEISI